MDLRADAATVALTVTDNGIGIAEAGRRSGLTNQRERAILAGALPPPGHPSAAPC